VIDEITAHGLHLSDLDGASASLAAKQLTLTDDPAALGGADLILVTVKSRDTEAMAGLVAAYARPDAVIVSLQNGVANTDRLRAAVAPRRVLAGMVPFNVLARGAGRFHRGTEGGLLIDPDQPWVAELLNVPHLPVATHPDMVSVQWGKLLINLNNALNALSGLSLRDQLRNRRWRKLLAAQQAEGLRLLKLAGIRPWSMGPVPIRLLPWLLRLPTPLFTRLARAAVRIDPHARSSMWEDLERRRPTEIAELQGALVDLAGRLGTSAPVNARIAALIADAEHAGAGSPGLPPEQIRLAGKTGSSCTAAALSAASRPGLGEPATDLGTDRRLVS
jgi:2-dehydropantoate 2-reductase